jgi:hypothetical protein
VVDDCDDVNNNDDDDDDDEGEDNGGGDDDDDDGEPREEEGEGEIVGVMIVQGAVLVYGLSEVWWAGGLCAV